ncbi:hypothetical protein Tco_0729998 [Tanacetum coccineum]|uniref:Uncharacterized protein n=1 Tax=Tanacetum coccineum TaxID=301880 RepID=A0ABQ4YRC5_9ASTR
MARQYTQPKRLKNLEWFKEKMLLAHAQEARVILYEENLALLADTRERANLGPDTQALTTTAMFQTDDLDAFDSDYDEAPSTSVVLMAKLSAYDSDVLSEVPNRDIYQDNNVIDQSVQEMQYFEQPVLVDDSTIDITNAMIMSVIEEMSTHVAKCNAVNQEHKTVNESLTAELERYKEQVKKFEER